MSKSKSSRGSSRVESSFEFGVRVESESERRVLSSPKSSREGLGIVGKVGGRVRNQSRGSRGSSKFEFRVEESEFEVPRSSRSRVESSRGRGRVRTKGSRESEEELEVEGLGFGVGGVRVAVAGVGVGGGGGGGLGLWPGCRLRCSRPPLFAGRVGVRGGRVGVRGGVGRRRGILAFLAAGSSPESVAVAVAVRLGVGCGELALDSLEKTVEKVSRSAMAMDATRRGRGRGDGRLLPGGGGGSSARRGEKYQPDVSQPGGGSAAVR